MNEVRAAPSGEPQSMAAPAGTPAAYDAARGPLLRAEQLSKTYLMGRVPLHVIRDCSVSVETGEFVAIMGKSGSGKSTLLHLLGALDVPDFGQVHFGGVPVFATSETQSPGQMRASAPAYRRFLPILLLGLALLSMVAHFWFGHGWPDLGRWSALGAAALLALAALAVFIANQHARERHRVRLRRMCFGFVFQFYHLLPELTVLENVLMTRMIGSSVWRWWTGERQRARDDALAVLNRVGLGERLRHRPSELSGGERQRVAIARALIHRPAILFADEPTGNLDAAAGRQLMALLAELNNDGQTIVLVTHDPSVAGKADRVLYLEDGRLLGSRELEASMGKK